MSKIIKFNQEARTKLQVGINKLADAVISTLGPYGRNVLIEKDGELVQSTKDGVTVAKSISLEDPIENMGAEIVKQASIKSAAQAGDGTTTTTLLAKELINEGLKHLDKSSNAVEIKKGMDAAVKQVISYIQTDISEDISSEDQLLQIATISSNNDETTGKLISTAIEKVGRDGIVTIEESKSGETSLEIVEGMQFDRGYKSPYFVTNNDNMQCTLENPQILIYDGKLMQAKELVPLLENISQKNVPLLIIAEDIDGEALATLIVNKIKGTLKVCAVKAPEFGDRRTLILEDIAVLTGGEVVSPIKGMRLDKISTDVLGTCRIANIDKNLTTIIDGAGDIEKISNRILEIKKQLDKSSSNFETEKLQERLGKMTGGVAIINVGGSNEIDIKEYRDRVEDALFATKAAIEEGVIPGGGAALLHSINSITWDDKKESIDFIRGKKIVKEALNKPFMQILINAGHSDAHSIMYNISSKGKWMGYDLKTNKIVNMKDKGIIDPTKVTRLALENAAAVAGIILTTETTIYTKPEEKNKDIQPQLDY